MINVISVAAPGILSASDFCTVWYHKANFPHFDNISYPPVDVISGAHTLFAVANFHSVPYSLDLAMKFGH